MAHGGDGKDGLDDLSRFHFPPALNARLQALLDRQDRGESLSASEREEAELLAKAAELISLLKLRCGRH